MKKVSKNKQKLTKGMPGAMVLSTLIHAALFLLAGMLVVFNIVKKEEKKFVPPKPVERPKMKLRKPKVKVRKTSKPKATTRIVTKVKRASMPQIQLPEMSGMGEGLFSGLDGLLVMPDLSDDLSVFGGEQSIGNDFVGVFYDLKRKRNGGYRFCDGEIYFETAVKFLQRDWDPSVLAHLYKSPKKRYATTFMMPPLLSAQVPAIFGEPDTEGIYWYTHYKGKLVHKDGITFRFIGQGDGSMAVRVDGENVLVEGWLADRYGRWNSTSADQKKYYLGNSTAAVGDWITLEPGVPLDMEVYLCEGGGVGCFMLSVEEKGVEYERRSMGGGPTWPAFKTARISRDMLDVISRDLVEGEASLTNGPVFSDYGTTAPTSIVENTEPAAAALPEPAPAEPALRIWTSVDGKTMEAEFVAVIGGKAVLKPSRGRTKKLPLAQLCAEDRLRIELARPPKLDIDFGAKTKRVYSIAKVTTQIPIAFDYQAKLKIRQTSAGDYNHELSVEFLTFGEEIHGRKYILLDRQTSSFTPTKENERSHEFEGMPLQIRDFIMYEQHRGIKPYGYVATVTDERGVIVAHVESNAWLYENLGKIKQLKVGVYLDKSGARVFPTGPKRTLY